MLLHKSYTSSSLRISDLAEACYVSEVHFRNAFGSHYKKSPQQVLKELRFHRVCELLRSGYYTQKEASSLAGFSDVKYFCASFRKNYGITPAEYIKNVNKEEELITLKKAPILYQD